MIIHTDHFMNAARLALAFRAVQCRVQVLSRRSHPVHWLGRSAVERFFSYNPFAPLHSFRSAIAAAAPDIIIACDDWAVRLLHQLYLREVRRSGRPSRMADVIGRSLGRPEAYGLLSIRSRLAEIAAKANVRIPFTEAIGDLRQLEAWLRAQGYPAVVKRDHSYAGAGVDIVHDLAAARRSLCRMIGWRNFARMVKRAALNSDTEWMFDTLWRTPTGVSAQAYVHGTPANCAVACWNGEMLAGICVEAVATNGPTGRARVLRVVDNSEMLQTAERVVGTFGLSGFCGLDFMLEKETGRAQLIEINPRATQINHLALGGGRDLVAALRARLTGTPLRERPAVTDQDLIVVFPAPSGSEAAGRASAGAYYDVPCPAAEGSLVG